MLAREALQHNVSRHRRPVTATVTIIQPQDDPVWGDSGRSCSGEDGRSSLLQLSIGAAALLRDSRPVGRCGLREGRDVPWLSYCFREKWAIAGVVVEVDVICIGVSKLQQANWKRSVGNTAGNRACAAGWVSRHLSYELGTVEPPLVVHENAAERRKPRAFASVADRCSESVKGEASERRELMRNAQMQGN